MKKVIILLSTSMFALAASASSPTVTYSTGERVKTAHSYSEVMVSECSDSKGEYKQIFFGDQRTAFTKFIESTSNYQLKVEEGKVVIRHWNGEPVIITCTEAGLIND